jgi:hypothetical protein
LLDPHHMRPDPFAPALVQYSRQGLHDHLPHRRRGGTRASPTRLPVPGAPSVGPHQLHIRRTELDLEGHHPPTDSLPQAGAVVPQLAVVQARGPHRPAQDPLPGPRAPHRPRRLAGGGAEETPRDPAPFVAVREELEAKGLDLRLCLGGRHVVMELDSAVLC